MPAVCQTLKDRKERRMKETNIYIEISSVSPKSTRKGYGYVIEALHEGKPVTRTGFGEIEGTYHLATLTALIDALKRYNKPSEIHLICGNGFVLGQLKNVKMWLKNGFVTAKGKPVTNSEEWRKVAALIAQHTVIPEKCDHHSYSGWMQSEMTKRQEGQNV